MLPSLHSASGLASPPAIGSAGCGLDRSPDPLLRSARAARDVGLQRRRSLRDRRCNVSRPEP
ncbi:MAG TPA: hypothetical protein VKJ00_09105, partial [Thermoanaerobaculia bacterium]|nr:hypothetical protein [Thermoanaerobaculia bacterium]